MAFGLRANGLAVGHLRLANIGFDAKFAPHAVHDDFQMQLAHASQNRLARFLVGVHPEGRIFILEAAGHIRHLHIANPQGRVFPRKWEEYDYAPFFANLRKTGYDKRISVEGATKDLAADGPPAVALLRRAFER